MNVAAQPDAELLRFAGDLADTAGSVIRPYYRTPVAVDDKPDASPVTIADRETERAMRRAIEARYPEHGVIGEEFASVRPDADYLWILDPIDGTKQFITGKPTFGTLIALLHRGTPILGVIDIPMLGERWLGALGHPTLFRDTGGERSVRCRPCPSLDRAMLYTTAPENFLDRDRSRLQRLSKSVKVPSYGGDCFNYGLLASGFCDLVVDGTMDGHDFAALIPIIEGAGGIVSDAAGNRLRPVESECDFVLAAGDARTHAAALDILAG